MKKRNRRVSIGLITLLSISFLMSGCGFIGGDKGEAGRGTAQAAGPHKPETPKFKIPVTAQVLHRGPMNAYLQAVGTIRPLREIEVKSEASGRIYFEKRWGDGDYVDGGTLLARIDDTEIQLDIQEAERALELAQQALIPAEATMKRMQKEEEFCKKMFERGAYSEVQYEQARLERIRAESQYKQALNTVESRKTSIEKLKKQLEKTDIIAPWPGILLPAQQAQAGRASAQETDLTLLEGTLVGAGQTVLRLAEIRQVVVELDVPAKDIEFVDLGQKVQLDIYSKSGRQYIGTVQDISSTLNPTTRTYTVKVNVDNPLGELRPGMFSKARIITQTKLDAISIPRELVMLRNNKNIVFVVEQRPQEPEVSSATSTVSAATGVAATTMTAANVNDASPQPSVIADATGAVASGNPENATDEVEPGEEFEEEEAPEAMIAKRREVILGIENREEVEIVEGLGEGDLLVVLGYETLTDGVDVNVTVRGSGDEAEDNEGMDL